MMVLEFMFSVLYPIDFEILENTHRGSAQSSTVQSIALWSGRKWRPTERFRMSLLLWFTSKNIGSALPTNQSHDSGLITERHLLLGVENTKRNSKLSILALGCG